MVHAIVAWPQGAGRRRPARVMARTSRRKRTYVIGDIHGCLDPLKALMDRLAPRQNDEIIFIGDYIDRGPDPKGVVDYVLAFRKARPGKVTCLMGNHEWMLINYLDGIDRELWLANGGQTTLDSYGGEAKIPQEHLDFFYSLSPFRQTDDYLFVHAGIRPGVPFEEQRTEDMLWIRREFYQFPGRFSRPVIFGHTPLKEVFQREDRIGIDTGCVFGGKLTGLVLPGRQIIQVDGLNTRPPVETLEDA